MSHELWSELRPPSPEAGAVVVWEGEPSTPAEVTAGRRQLKRAVLQGQTPAGADEDDVERLLLAFEELASNGLRHGGAPVRAAVTRTADGWLIDVTDAVADRVPTPAVDRDPAHGGLGLYLVARLGAAHGWWRQPDHKHVWARIRAGGAV
ncbi:ATP-binding protein [Blastococcus sp. CT_GayMR20]|nr:ATP-binding protein [Blastococcus sp. CT_GayMR20]